MEQYVQGNQIYKVLTVEVCGPGNDRLGYMKIFYNLTREKSIERLKSEFISIAAHQLRTPLSAIKWVLRMVIDGDTGKITKEQKATLLKGYDCNERVIKLVNDMLSVSRIEEGKFGYTFKNQDLSKIIETVVDELGSLIKEQKINFSLEKPDKLPLVYMDQEKIEMVVENLIDNAIKYTPENGTVGITVKKKDGFINVKIKDNGIGIPKNEQAKLFSKFFRAQNVVRVETDGSGLGLFITRNIIEKHGGTISIKSEEGVGTEVNFSLPFRE